MEFLEEAEIVIVEEIAVVAESLEEESLEEESLGAKWNSRDRSC